jgi:hypothetical protein
VGPLGPTSTGALWVPAWATSPPSGSSAPGSRRVRSAPISGPSDRRGRLAGRRWRPWAALPPREGAPRGRPRSRSRRDREPLSGPRLLWVRRTGHLEPGARASLIAAGACRRRTRGAPAFVPAKRESREERARGDADSLVRRRRGPLPCPRDPGQAPATRPDRGRVQQGLLSRLPCGGNGHRVRGARSRRPVRGPRRRARSQA